MLMMMKIIPQAIRRLSISEEQSEGGFEAFLLDMCIVSRQHQAASPKFDVPQCVKHQCDGLTSYFIVFHEIVG